MHDVFPYDFYLYQVSQAIEEALAHPERPDGHRVILRHLARIVSDLQDGYEACLLEEIEAIEMEAY